MDAFESLVAQLLQEDGYWVLQSVKVNLTKEEKVKISKPTAPRPEIDIVALNFYDNCLYLLEVKSFLDSKGVEYDKVTKKQEVQEGRYKLLTSKSYRDIVTYRLRIDLLEKKQINRKTKLSYGLIAGKVCNNREDDFDKYFKSNDWFFWGPSKIKQKLINLSEKGYENNSVTLAMKLVTKDLVSR